MDNLKYNKSHAPDRDRQRRDRGSGRDAGKGT